MSIKMIDGETGELLPAPRNLPSQLFEEFDRLDDDQIMAELRGAVVEEYVYQFKQAGSMITGLSVTGVMAVAQHMGGITCGQPVWSITEESTCCDISATDHKTGLTIWGTCEEERVKRLKNGGSQVDKFVRQKALSKAQRNAIRKLIPEKIATEMIKAFIDGKKSGPARSFEARERQPQRAIDAPRQPSPTPPPTKDRAAIETTGQERQPAPTDEGLPGEKKPSHYKLTPEQKKQIEDLRDAIGAPKATFDAWIRDTHTNQRPLEGLTMTEADAVIATLTKRLEAKRAKEEPKQAPQGEDLDLGAF